MNCDSFATWLDAGMPAVDAAAAHAHAAVCARCAAALEAEHALDVLLAAPPAEAPAAFTEAVMARVQHVPQAMAELPAAPVLPWWVRMAAEPAAAGALALAALLTWRPGALAPARLLAARASEWLGAHPLALPSLGIAATPTSAWTIAFAGLVCAGLAAWALFLLGETLAAGVAPTLRPAR